MFLLGNAPFYTHAPEFHSGCTKCDCNIAGAHCVYSTLSLRASQFWGAKLLKTAFCYVCNYAFSRAGKVEYLVNLTNICLIYFRRCALERKLEEADVTEEEQTNLLKDLERKETEYMRLQRHKMGVDDFELLTIIGRGAFGEVRVGIHKILVEDASYADCYDSPLFCLPVHSAITIFRFR